MTQFRRIVVSTAMAATAAIAGACSSSDTVGPAASGTGTMVVRLTDAPFSSDLVARVDMYVVRVDARVADVDSSEADYGLSDDSVAVGGWQTIARPNASFNLLALQNGVTTTIGQAVLPAATYSGFRFIIDPARSSVTLKTGQVLTGTSSPGVKFPSANRSGIKVVLAQPVTVVPNTITTLLIDFDVNNSFVMRGNTIDKNGLLFKPVIKASVTNLALTNATIRLVNASDSTLTLLQNAIALTGSSNLGFGASSSCSSVNALTPLLSVTTAASTLALPGFAPLLAAGHSFSLIAYPVTLGGVQFATLPNDYLPATGSAGLRVFNATSVATPFDVYVTAPGAALGAATFANVGAGGKGSTFIAIPAGVQEIRVTPAGSATVLVDLTSQSFAAGQNLTLVIAPPMSPATTPRAFLSTGC